MTVVAFKRAQTDTRTGTFSPLSAYASSEDYNTPSELDAVIRNALISGMDQLKAAIEVSIIQTVSRRLLASRIHQDNPFDAIYLADLTPDPLNRVDMKRILQKASVIDLSDKLQIDDGWDD